MYSLFEILYTKLVHLMVHSKVNIFYFWLPFYSDSLKPNIPSVLQDNNAWKYAYEAVEKRVDNKGAWRNKNTIKICKAMLWHILKALKLGYE